MLLTRTRKSKDRDRDARSASKVMNKVSRQSDLTPPLSPALSAQSETASSKLPVSPKSLSSSSACKAAFSEQPSPALSAVSLVSNPQKKSEASMTSQSKLVNGQKEPGEDPVSGPVSKTAESTPIAHECLNTGVSSDAPSIIPSVNDTETATSAPDAESEKPITTTSEASSKNKAENAETSDRKDASSPPDNSSSVPLQQDVALELVGDTSSGPVADTDNLHLTQEDPKTPSAPPPADSDLPNAQSVAIEASKVATPQTPATLASQSRPLSPGSQRPLTSLEPYPSPSHPGYQSSYYMQSAPGLTGPYYAIPDASGYRNAGRYGMHPQHGPSPYHVPYGNFSTRLGSYGPASSIPPHSSNMDGENISSDDDAGDLLSRISSAIPDLHLLLSRYKETHGQLGIREELIRKAEAQQADMLKRKEDYIDTLSKQLENAAKHHSAESNKLRLEIGNLEEKHKELEERIAEAEASKKEMEETKAALEAQKAALEQEKAELEKSTAEEKERLLKEFEDWKTKANEAFESEKKAKDLEFEKKRKEQEDAVDAQKTHTNEEHLKEKEIMRAAFQRQKRDLETSFDRVRKELELKLNSAQRDLEEALKKERESRELWSTERESLVKGWEEEREGLGKGYEEQRQLLTSQHQKEKDDLQRVWMDLQAEITRKYDEEMEILLKEKTTWNEEKASYERVVDELKGVTENLDIERGKLQKMIDCLGEVPELKSKGDAYFIEAFDQLSKEILDLTAVHFNDPPPNLPAEVIDLIPLSVPSFLDSSPSARHIRAAYITHTISSIPTVRVFTPFLFSLGHRHEKSDSLFTAISNQLRSKSTRKEAVWRQHTLIAAFTSADAKRHINAAAGVVVEEIVEAVKYFANPSQEEAIRLAMRRIVKLAAETWRFARLEREMITARMPPVDEENDEDQVLGFWPAQTYDSAIYPVQTTEAASGGQSTQHKILLRLLPVIERNPSHECFQVTEKDKEDVGCIYSYGLALYDDSPPVLVRKQELHVASSSPPPGLSDTMPDMPPPVPPVVPLPDIPQTEQSHILMDLALPPPTPPGPATTRSNSPSLKGTNAGQGPQIPLQAPTPPSPLNAAVIETDAPKPCNVQERPVSRRSTGTSNRSASTRSSGGGDSRMPPDGRSAAIKGLYETPLRSSGGTEMERSGSGRSIRSDRSGRNLRAEAMGWGL